MMRVFFCRIQEQICRNQSFVRSSLRITANHREMQNCNCTGECLIPEMILAMDNVYNFIGFCIQCRKPSEMMHASVYCIDCCDVTTPHIHENTHLVFLCSLDCERTAIARTDTTLRMVILCEVCRKPEPPAAFDETHLRFRSCAICQNGVFCSDDCYANRCEQHQSECCQTVMPGLLQTRYRDVRCGDCCRWIPFVFKAHRCRFCVSGATFCSKVCYRRSKHKQVCVPRCNNCPKQLDKYPVCGRCRAFAYCSRECQIHDWHRHKPQCIPKEEF